jgi:hypothetical protein
MEKVFRASTDNAATGGGDEGDDNLPPSGHARPEARQDQNAANAAVPVVDPLESIRVLRIRLQRGDALHDWGLRLFNDYQLRSLLARFTGNVDATYTHMVDRGLVVTIHEREDEFIESYGISPGPMLRLA